MSISDCSLFSLLRLRRSRKSNKQNREATAGNHRKINTKSFQTLLMVSDSICGFFQFQAFKGFFTMNYIKSA
nr:hypothetical protein CFP56_76566 [Quercus suber]